MRFSRRRRSTADCGDRRLHRRLPDEIRVDPICRVLTEHGIKIAPSTYYAAQQQESSPVSAAALADAYAANAVFDLGVANRRV